MLFYYKTLFYKLFTSIDGYFYYGVSPILFFLITQDLKKTSVFLLMEAIVKFCSYGISGTVSNLFNPYKVFIFSFIARNVFAISSLIFFSLLGKESLFYVVLCNYGFIIMNSLITTNFDLTEQKKEDYNVQKQAMISSGDLFAGTFAMIFLLGLTFFKVDLIYYVIIHCICCLIGVKQIKQHNNKNTHTLFENMTLKYTLSRVWEDLIKTIVVFKTNKDLLLNTIVGYIPFSIFLIFEQSNIFYFAQKLNVYEMRNIHFLLKTLLFFSSGLLIPIILSKIIEIKKILMMSMIFLLIGSFLSIIKYSLLLDFIGIILLGLSHTLVLNYRKINRRNIFFKKNITFSTLGFVFAIEGLSAIFSNTFLSIFGMNKYALSSFIIIGLSYMYYCYKKTEN